MAELAQTQGYLRAWEAIGELLSSGRSWSGRERNCCFLNTRDGRFASTAALLRLDSPADSRAIGLTDWDGDGDLDFWLANRTSPRVQFFRNPAGADTHFLRVKLVGTRCNRDAIGARVELHSAGNVATEPRSVRFVRAGEGYLAQSSSTLHFGLGRASGPVNLSVHWPDGSKAEFLNLAIDRTLRIVQGSDHVDQAAAREPLRLAVQPEASVPSAAAFRVIAHRPLPVPSLPATARDGTEIDLSVAETQAAGNGARGTLLVLWTSWCQPCLTELAALDDASQRMRELGLHVWAGNVEQLELPAPTRIAAINELWNKMAWNVPAGVLRRDAVEHLDLLQRLVPSRRSALGVPSSFLLDHQRRLVAIYHGPVAVEQLVNDLRLLDCDVPTYRQLSLPFPGRWYLNPLPVDLLAVADRLLENGELGQSLHYLSRYAGTPLAPAAGLDSTWYEIFSGGLADMYTRIGIELARLQQFDGAEEVLSAALAAQADNWEALAALASLHSQRGQTSKALASFERMLALRPQDMLVTNNVAWILATSNDDAIRDPQRAFALAQSVCRSTNRRVPTALDTLAAAYAALGQFDEAVRTAEEAEKLLGTGGPTPAVESLRKRIDAYRRGEAVRE